MPHCPSVQPHFSTLPVLSGNLDSGSVQPVRGERRSGVTTLAEPREVYEVMAEDEVVAALEAASAMPRCILCGRPSIGVHVFHPFDSPRYGAPLGKQRVFFLPICDGCEREPLENLEEAILELAERGVPR